MVELTKGVPLWQLGVRFFYRLLKGVSLGKGWLNTFAERDIF